MAVAYPFTGEDKVRSIIGQLGLDLRLDDAADAAEAMEYAIDEASSEVYGYLAQRYGEQACSENNWVQWHAAWFAVVALCRRRLNPVPESVTQEWERRQKQLERVLARKMPVPGLAASRRPVAVNNYTVDLNRYNNQVRVDRNRSTGVARDYRRRTDENSPDGG